MFGHVQANLGELKINEYERYGAFYCGLCRTLGERHGTLSKMGLTYDLSFLSLLLSALYEPIENTGKCRCLIHPAKKHSFVCTEYTDYAADMTIALVYHKCLDDWKDDKSLAGKAYSSALSSSYKRVKERLPSQCEEIEKELLEISRIESDKEASPDLAINASGRMMAAVFSYKSDYFTEDMRTVGYNLGRFIYLADAAVDYERDKKSGAYNPLLVLGLLPEDVRPSLKSFLGDASAAFEKLPIIKDAEILRNILYSGIWIKYNNKMKERTEVRDGG